MQINKVTIQNRFGGTMNIVHTLTHVYAFSYGVCIACKSKTTDEPILLDRVQWENTNKTYKSFMIKCIIEHRNLFLNKTTEEIKEAIANGSIVLVDLN